jgi:hypothetical protein
VGSGWSKPARLPDTVNFACQSICKPSIIADGPILHRQKGGKRLCSSQYTNGAYQQAQPFPFSDGTTLDVDPEIARTLYFSSDRAVPAHFPRSPEQAQLNFKHLDSLGWFSGYANVWSIPISASLNAEPGIGSATK